MVRSGSTMQLTRAADHAVRVMIHMASLPANQRALLPGLARATGAPGSFLSKVLQALCRAGMIDSRRGQAGGFEILDRGRRATMREVIEAIDGPIYINLCMISGASCERKSYCPAHPFWSKAQEAMLSVLNGAIVSDLAAQVSATSPRGTAVEYAHSDKRLAGLAKKSRG